MRLRGVPALQALVALALSLSGALSDSSMITIVSLNPLSLASPLREHQICARIKVADIALRPGTGDAGSKH